MKVRDGWIDDWATEADPPEVSIPEFLAGFCVLVSLVIVVCVYVLVLTPR